MGGDQEILAAVRLLHGDEGVALLQRQCPDANVLEILQGLHRQALHGAVPRHHGEEELALRAGTVVQHGLHPLAGLHLDEIHDIAAPGGLAGLGDLVALLAVDLAGVREEEEVIVGRGGEDVGDGVLLPGSDALLSHASLALGGILADGGAL